MQNGRLKKFKKAGSIAYSMKGMHDILSRLRYEGDTGFERNFKQARKVERILEKNLNELMDLEETFLFPFLRAHIPRLEPLISILTNEHEDFRRLFKDFSRDVASLKKSRHSHSFVIQKIRNSGFYLLCLLKSHLWIENKQIYATLRQELKPHEKILLARELEDHEALWSLRRNGKIALR